jgi:hypothetical protein
MNPTAVALALASGLLLLGGLTGAAQVRGLRRLRDRKHLPSDERAYLRGRYRRRLLTAVLLGLVGGLIAGAYLSGLEARTDALTGQPVPEGETRPPLTDAQRDQVRTWGLYWAGVIVLLITLIGLAVLDAVATRRFWYGQLRRLREEHQTQLRRDLAVHRAQREKHRGGITGRRVDGADE